MTEVENLEVLRKSVKELIRRNRGDVEDTLTYLDQNINTLTLLINASSDNAEQEIYRKEVMKMSNLKLLFQMEQKDYELNHKSEGIIDAPVEQEVKFPLPPKSKFTDYIKIHFKKAQKKTLTLLKEVKKELPYLKKKNRILRKLPEQNLVFFSKEITREHYHHLADAFYRQFDDCAEKVSELDKEIEGKDYNNFTRPRVGGF